MACEAFAGAKAHRQAYTRRKRKETLDEITELAKTITETLAQTNHRRDHAASCLAVETWLQQNGVITV